MAGAPRVDDLLTKHGVVAEQLLPGPEGVGDAAANDLQYRNGAESTRADPRALNQAQRLKVTVADGRIFLPDGRCMVAVGSGGCENPLHAVGCAPYVITNEQAIRSVYALQPSTGDVSIR